MEVENENESRGMAAAKNLFSKKLTNKSQIQSDKPGGLMGLLNKKRNTQSPGLDKMMPR